MACRTFLQIEAKIATLTIGKIRNNFISEYTKLDLRASTEFSPLVQTHIYRPSAREPEFAFVRR